MALKVALTGSHRPYRDPDHDRGERGGEPISMAFAFFTEALSQAIQMPNEIGRTSNISVVPSQR